MWQGGISSWSPRPSPLSCRQSHCWPPPVFLVVPAWYASDDGRIIWERPDLTVVWVVPEVWGVQTKQKGRENCALWRPRADYHLGQTVMKPHVLWSLGEVVDGLRSQLLVHSSFLQLPSQQCKLEGVESTGEVKKHDPHSAPRLLLVRERSVQIDDSVLHSDTRPVGELQGLKRRAHQRAKVVQDEPLQGLHQVGSQSYRSRVIGLPGAIFGTGTTQEVFHSSGTLSRRRLSFKVFLVLKLDFLFTCCFSLRLPLCGRLCLFVLMIQELPIGGLMCLVWPPIANGIWTRCTNTRANSSLNYCCPPSLFCHRCTLTSPYELQQGCLSTPASSYYSGIYARSTGASKCIRFPTMKETNGVG